MDGLACRLVPRRRVRRITHHAAAVFEIMHGERDRDWSIDEVAQRIRVEYSSAYALLKRLFNDGFCARIDHGDAAPNQPSVFYSLTPKGRAKAKVVLADMPHPQRALVSWIIDEQEPAQVLAS